MTVINTELNVLKFVNIKDCISHKPYLLLLLAPSGTVTLRTSNQKCHTGVIEGIVVKEIGVAKQEAAGQPVHFGRVLVAIVGRS